MGSINAKGNPIVMTSNPQDFHSDNLEPRGENSRNQTRPMIIHDTSDHGLHLRFLQHELMKLSMNDEFVGQALNLRKSSELGEQSKYAGIIQRHSSSCHQEKGGKLINVCDMHR